MLVHFASGVHPFDAPWHNVDLSGADQDVDLLDEFPDNLDGIEIAYVGHWLEHMSLDEAGEFLVRVRERMAPGGRIVVVGPDVEKATAWRQRGELPDPVWDAIRVHGTPDGNNRGGCHLWDCTAHQVIDLLADAGWQDPAEFPIGELTDRHPDVPMINDSSWQLAVDATAPKAAPAKKTPGRHRKPAAKN